LKVSDPSHDVAQVHLAGCQLWLSKSLSHGISLTQLLIAGHALSGVVVALFGLAALTKGGTGGSIAALGLLLMAAVYIYIVCDSRRIARRPAAKLSWWQMAGWNAILSYYRSRGWQPRNRQVRWKVLDLRNRPLSDAQIIAIPEITQFHVIDLEGTQLTDAGLIRLQGLSHLQRLVVRRTQVAPRCVFAVQQRLRHTWIWS
jgi:hypothetical protein